jgi:hypothetical protein
LHSPLAHHSSRSGATPERKKNFGKSFFSLAISLVPVYRNVMLTNTTTQNTGHKKMKNPPQTHDEYLAEYYSGDMPSYELPDRPATPKIRKPNIVDSVLDALGY